MAKRTATRSEAHIEPMDGRCLTVELDRTIASPLVQVTVKEKRRGLSLDVLLKADQVDELITELQRLRGR